MGTRGTLPDPRRQWGLFLGALFLLVSPERSLWASQDDTAKQTKEVLDVSSGVMSEAYPPAGLVLKGMTDMMDMLGFFDGPDPLQPINDRLDALAGQIARLEGEVELMRGDALRERNHARLTRLRESREQLKAIAAALAEKPTDNAMKVLLVRQAQAEAHKFLDIEDMWTWSDLVTKDHKWNGQAVKASTMLDPDFRPMPTLEYYSTALMIWALAIEQATDGNADRVKRGHAAALQEHIAFLSTRLDWNEASGKPQTLPEQIKARVNGLYEPATSFPVKRICTIDEYLEDSLARKLRHFGDMTYTSKTDNEMCNVPQGLIDRPTPTEEEVEGNYGITVMTLLAEKLTRLRDHGTMREPFVGTFDPTYYAQETLYEIEPDGDLIWQRHRIATKITGTTLASPAGPIARSNPTGQIGGGRPADATLVAGKPVETIKEYKAFNVEGRKTVGTGWGFKRVFSDSAGVIYVVNNEGKLGWYRHTGYEKGEGLESATAWAGPTEVGAGWGDFSHVFAAGDGVIYAIDRDGQLRWYKHDAHLTGAGLETAGAWHKRSADIVQIGWTDVRLAFSGGNGVIYVVTNDGRLLWYRHSRYLDAIRHPITVDESRPQAIKEGFRVQWGLSWQGPKEVGQGWTFAQVFSAGDGDIYAVTAEGTLRWYKHLGYEDGSQAWWQDKMTGLQYREIATGWGDAHAAFAVLPGTAPPNTGPRVH